MIPDEYTPRSRPATPGMSPWSILVPFLIMSLFLGGLWYFGFFGREQRPLNDPTAQPRVATPATEKDAEEKERIRVFKESKNSVVNVDTVLLAQDWDRSLVEQQTGTGSGFIWDEKGNVVTNFHVIQGAFQRNRNVNLRVTLADRTSWNARLVGISPDHDLAVLQIDAPKDKLKPIRIGTSKDLEVGQTVFAIGNPFGQSLTMTMGIVSALDREIQSVTERPITGVIQTDAALNPGNSGGPLLDKDGRLIGVNTAITSPSGGSVGIGYSIPVDTVNEVVPQLIRSGRTSRPVLGIVPLPDSILRRAGIETGVMIQQVTPNGPAAKAGLQGIRKNRLTGQNEPGDLILTIRDEPVTEYSDLDRILAKCKIQEKVKVTFRRGDEVLETEVTLEGI